MLFKFNNQHIINIDHLVVTCPTDQCTTQNGNIPWYVVDDRTIVCNVPSSGEKVVTTLASLVCDVTKTRGITEIRVIDHALSPKLKAWCVQKPHSVCFFFWVITLRIIGIIGIIGINLSQAQPDGSQQPLTYRYRVQPDHKVNCFKPKDITDDKLSLRGAQFGAVWNGKMLQLPKTAFCDVVWEAWCLKTT